MKKNSVSKFIDDSAQDDNDVEELDFGGDYTDDGGLSDEDIHDLPSDAEVEETEYIPSHLDGNKEPLVFQNIIQKVERKIASKSIPQSVLSRYSFSHGFKRQMAARSTGALSSTSVAPALPNPSIPTPALPTPALPTPALPPPTPAPPPLTTAPPPSTPVPSHGNTATPSPPALPTSRSFPPVGAPESPTPNNETRKRSWKSPSDQRGEMEMEMEMMEELKTKKKKTEKYVQRQEEEEEEYDFRYDEAIPQFQRDFAAALDSSARQGIQTLYDIFLLRCKRGQEKRIFDRITTDLKALNGNGLLAGSIAAVYSSISPGHIYLQSVNMEPTNEELCQYFYDVHGFLYSGEARVSSSAAPTQQSRVILSADSIAEAKSIRPVHYWNSDRPPPVLTFALEDVGHVPRSGPSKPLTLSKSHRARMPINTKLPQGERLPEGINSYTSLGGVRFTLPPWEAASWVRVKAGKGYLYNGDVGFVMSSNDERIDVEKHLQFTVVALVPRMGVVQRDGKIFRAPRQLFDYVKACNYSARAGIEPPLYKGYRAGPMHRSPCKHSFCKTSNWDQACVHQRIWEWRGSWFQSGLDIIVFPNHLLERAPPSISYSVIELFRSSQHLDLIFQEALWHNMPLREDWPFELGDNVCFTSLEGDKYQGKFYSLGEQGDGFVEGVVSHVGEREIQVSYGTSIPTLITVSSWFLRKRFQPGDYVVTRSSQRGVVVHSSQYIPHDPKLGWRVKVAILTENGAVLDNGGAEYQANALRVDHEASIRPFEHPHKFTGQSSGFVSVGLPEPLPGGKRLLPLPIPSKPVHIPRTDKAPWLNTQALIFKQGHPRRTYWGIVHDVRIDPNTVSGLSVRLHLLDISQGDPWVWVDFDGLRSANKYYFIEGDPRGGPGLAIRRHYPFKHGYVPQLTLGEQQQEHREMRMRMLATIEEFRIEQELQELEKDYRLCVAMPGSPPPEEWLLDPRYKFALMKLEVIVVFNHGQFKDTAKPVVLIFEGKKLVPCIYNGPSGDEYAFFKSVEMSDIYQANAQKGKIGLQVGKLRGVYLIIANAADSKQEDGHVGKIVRRLAEDKEAGAGCEAQAYGGGFIKAIEVRFILVPGHPKNRGYLEEIVEPHNIFTVHRTSLLEVKISKPANKLGNESLILLRSEHGGQLERTEKDILPSLLAAKGL